MTRPARLIALLIVVVALGREGVPRAERPAAGKTVKPTIAVLYFDYTGADSIYNHNAVICTPNLEPCVRDYLGLA